MDRKIAILAENQHGVFTAEQARAVGFNREAMRHRVASGRWERLAEGVYRLPGCRRTWEQRLVAATLAAGPCAAASHRSAAALLAIPGFERRGVPEVTTSRARRHRCPGTIVHRWRPFPDDHLTVIDGIVTTRAARTLVDLAGVVHPRRAERAVDNCLVDFAYPRLGLLIELDGRRFHSALLDRRADAERDRRLRAAGWRDVVRLSWFDVVHQPELVVALLRRLLAEAAA